jgi:phage terminase small subunit
MSGLTDKQQAFINAYLTCWNATKAAIKAGYAESTARSQASRLLANVNISEAIRQRIEEQKISADETLLSLAEIARGDMSDFFSVYGKVPVLDFEKAQKNGKLGLIKKLSMKPDGISFELYDKQAALNTFAKHHGLINDKVDIKIDINIMIEFVQAMQEIGEDAESILRRMIEKAKQKADAPHIENK